jgi:hypothetical protein
MGFKDFNASYDYLSIKAGESREIVPVGEPDVKAKKDGNLSVLFNIADVETGSCKLLRCGVVLAGKIKSALRGGELIGKAALTLKREGSGMEDTRYEVVKVRPLDAKEVGEIKKIDQIDLKDIAVPESKKGKRK